MKFFEKLSNVSKKKNSLLCVGLDPYQEMIPTVDDLLSLNRRIINATIDLACAYKPNLAIYEGMGEAGLTALKNTIDFIREKDSDIPIIGDGKRGDIGNCSLAYTSMLFEKYKFDAVTANPYMGYDSIEPFIQYTDKGIYILCRTSNPGGQDIQELLVTREGKPRSQYLYEVVAELAQKWNTNGNIGLVVGATYPEQIERVREIVPDLPFLIPGVGFQGGNIENTVRAAVDSRGNGFVINVSRSIMDAGKTRDGHPSEYNMHVVANRIRNAINQSVSVLVKNPQNPEQQGYSNINRVNPTGEQTVPSKITVL